MRRIAVINQKGGVGKTTTAANLGAALARSGLRVLLIDLDPQAHLTLHFGIELTDEQPSVYDVMIESAPVENVARTVGENLKLVPSDIDLAAAESELVSVMGREVILREALAAAGGAYDVMLVDCPPSLGILTINALVAAGEVIIPLQAHFFALQGLSKLLNTVTLVRQRINSALKVSGVALCMHESATRLGNEVVQDLRQFLEAARGTGVAWADARLYDARIRRNIKLAEASSFGQAIFDYEPRSNGAADYAALAVEIFPEIRSAAAQWSRSLEMPTQPGAALPTTTGVTEPWPAETECVEADGVSKSAAVKDAPALDAVCDRVAEDPVEEARSDVTAIEQRIGPVPTVARTPPTDTFSTSAP